MRTLKIFTVLMTIIAAVAVSGFAQQEFTVTKDKTFSSTIPLDAPGLTGNSLAIVMVTPVAGTENTNPHPIGVVYKAGKWHIFNSDNWAMPAGAKYNVQFFPQAGPNQFLHLVTQQNLGTEGSYIDNPALNNRPGAQLKILQSSAPGMGTHGYGTNAYEARAAYSPTAGKWYIANINGSKLTSSIAYNIIVSSATGGTNTNTNPNGQILVPPMPLTRTPMGEPTRVTVGQPDTPPPTPISPGPMPGPIKTSVTNWVLHDDLQPTIAPNSQILLFIHGMDSRAEEADDITKALFAFVADPNRPAPQQSPPTPQAGASSQNTALAAVLQGLLGKYKGCILEKYETQANMASRGLDPNLSGITHTSGLQDRDTVACVAGNLCSRSSRLTGFAALQAQANSGNASNFQTKLERIIPKDCFDCQKHRVRHTKHVHCTMEAGGNSGFQGPYFEGCKAGVDLQALANTIINDIGGVITSLTGAVPQTQVVGGPSIATNYQTVSFPSPEPCENPDDRSSGIPKAVLAKGYYSPSIPQDMLDTPPPAGGVMNVPVARNLGQNEGRLRPELRKAAKDADPLQSLRLAAYQFADGNKAMGKAFADLSVTGHRSFEKFRLARPKESFCESILGGRPAQLSETNVLTGCRSALDRAYRVANFLRTGQRGDTPTEKTRKTNERIELGWIAVSGEDDSPHRPVNVNSSDYPQYDINVEVPAPLSTGSKPVTVRTRYWIAQSGPVGNTGKNLVMISLDLPTSGYTTNLDYDLVSPLDEIGKPKWTLIPSPIIIPNELLYVVAGVPPLPTGPITNFPDFQATGKTPLLDFIEDHIVSFAETLDQKIPVKSNLQVVMGGSLGGNMSFRLGRRPNVPWLPKSIVWSPASIWTSLGAGTDILKHVAPRTGWEGANQASKSPGDGDRAEFFASWDRPIVPVIVDMAQSDTWTSDYYACKKSAIAAARLDRQETYDPRFLAWHWRLGAEQLLYSHQSIDPATNRPRYMSNQKPMLLACGTEDRVRFNDICPATQRTAPLMTMTPGKALFLDKTGHSLDNERPTYFARQIIEFLGL